MGKYIGVVFSLFFNAAFGQVYQVENNIEVFVDNNKLQNPWMGGLNSGQYSKLDVNLDGKEDLVVFDRSANRINVFVDDNSSWKHEPELSALFPEGIVNWMLIRDFNNDGLPDIFTSDPLGIKVFVNISVADGLKWRLFNSRAPFPSPLLTKGFSDSPINIQLNSGDLPSIEDIDGDGDLDILVFRFSSISTIEYHQNQSIERTNSADSMQFVRITQQWGEFKECDCNSYAFGEAECPSSSGGRTEHQSGKSLLAIDMDGDGDKEAIIGEEECGFLHWLENVGNPQEAIMTSFTTDFPNEAQAVSIAIYPAAFYEDVDFDGVKDLLVAPNVATNNNFNIDFANSSWLYKNASSTAIPAFEFTQTNFLQDQMLDFGENASPAFFDYDNDGDLDMFVSSTLNQTGRLRASINYFKNIGTKEQPVFELENDDFLSLSAIGGINFKIQFADVNGDNLMDFILGATPVTSFTTSIYYLPGANSSTKFATEFQLLFANIGTDENFYLYDINGDGLIDLLLGKSTGRVEYYRNIGAKESADFILETATFYNLNFSSLRQNAAIDIADLNNDGKVDMLLGDARGNLTIYSDFLNKLSNPDEGQPLMLTINDLVGALRLGSKLRPVVTNLFNSDKPAVVLGTGQGGVIVLKEESAISFPDNSTVAVYPNPLSVNQTLNVTSQQTTLAKIVTTTGQVMMKNIQLTAGEITEINISQLSEGLYLLVLENNEEAIRFVVTR